LVKRPIFDQSARRRADAAEKILFATAASSATVAARALRIAATILFARRAIGETV
jgi:hypothetical protein